MQPTCWAPIFLTRGDFQSEAFLAQEVCDTRGTKESFWANQRSQSHPHLTGDVLRHNGPVHRSSGHTAHWSWWDFRRPWALPQTWCSRLSNVFEQSSEDFEGSWSRESLDLAGEDPHVATLSYKVVETHGKAQPGVLEGSRRARANKWGGELDLLGFLGGRQLLRPSGTFHILKF